MSHPNAALTAQMTGPMTGPMTGQIAGIVVAGHQVASGRSQQSPYPAGTIEMQTSHFAALGVDLSPFYPGTLNVSIAPYQFELSPSITLPDVKWSPHHKAESFSFVPVRLIWQQQTFDGLIYYPRLETKIDHFQDPSVIELLLPKIKDITYGCQVALLAPSSELIIKP